MVGCHTARKPLLFMCLRGVNDYLPCRSLYIDGLTQLTGF